MKIMGFFILLMMMIMLGVNNTARAEILSPSNTISVTTFIDEYNDTDTGCSLREAITSANTDSAFGGCSSGGAGSDTITLPASSYNLTRSGYDN